MMKNETARQKQFWDKIAEKYARDPIADENAYNRKLKKTREYFTPKSQVFEFGCGTGATALLHAPLVAHVDAIDLSSAMIAIAQRKAREADVSNISFAEADINAMANRDGAYDVALGLSVLHLVRDRASILKKLHVLLKPGGVFISSTACLEDMGAWKYLLPAMQLIGKAPYVWVFSADQLVADQTEAGFDIIHQWQPKKGAAVFLIAQKR